MSTLKNGKFWGGVIVGVIFCYVYQNHIRGRVGG